MRIEKADQSQNDGINANKPINDSYTKQLEIDKKTGSAARESFSSEPNSTEAPRGIRSSVKLSLLSADTDDPNSVEGDEFPPPPSEPFPENSASEAKEQVKRPMRNRSERVQTQPGKTVSIEEPDPARIKAKQKYDNSLEGKTKNFATNLLNKIRDRNSKT